MKTIRDTGKGVLATLFSKQQNIDIIERCLWNSMTSDDEDDIISEYNKKLYEIMEFYNGNNIKETHTYIKENKFDHGHSEFDIIRKKEQEHDDFLINPFEVSEGVLECSKCGSKQTISTSKQTRAGDESTTVFAMCVKCNATWKI